MVLEYVEGRRRGLKMKIDRIFLIFVLILCKVAFLVGQGGDQIKVETDVDRETAQNLEMKFRNESILWESLNCFFETYQEDTRDDLLLKFKSTYIACFDPNEDEEYPIYNSLKWTFQPESSVSVKLMCRNNESMTLITEIEEEEGLQYDNRFYLTRISPDPRYSLPLSLLNKTTIDHLESDTLYDVVSYLLILSANGSVEVIASSTTQIRTLSNDQIPSEITHARQADETLNQYSKLDINVVWHPVEERVCFYHIVIHSPEILGRRNEFELDVRKEDNVFDYLSFPMKNLSFNLRYSVMIFAKDRFKEGPKHNFLFRTPSALFDAPVNHSEIEEDPFHWQRIPSFIPKPEEKINIWKIILSAVVITTIVIILIVALLQTNRLYNRRGGTRLQNPGEDLIELQSIPSDFTIYLDNEEDLTVDRIKMENILGQGAFGLVRKAIITMGDREETVAVKMLRRRANDEELLEFMHEIDVMKSVTHPNIVKLIGHSKAQNPQMMILIEYCCKGNLLNFLRDEWKALRRLDNGGVFEEQEPLLAFQGNADLFGNFVENRSYGALSLSNRHLISMAYQIALGMDYLATNKVVHRDLAARNILVCDNNVVKISDFGLSRDVYQDNMYKKQGSGKLPIKWLAIESLTHQVYTTQSDVWSFGILLYEILTLGGDPYPLLLLSDILRFLNAGYRMEKPRNCPKEIYAQMLDCWRTNPSERPSFKLICKQLKIFLNNMTDEAAKIVLEGTVGTGQTNNHSYLNPI